jgi:hypothetical protein
MELREFVTETLVAIQEGVQGAIRHVSKNPEMLGRINPIWLEGETVVEGWKNYVQPVEFDVAVTTMNKASKDGKGGGSVEVLAIANINVGAEGSKSSEHSIVNRIKIHRPNTSCRSHN